MNLTRDQFSRTPRAVRQRTRRMASDVYNEHVNELSRNSKRRLRVAEVRKNANWNHWTTRGAVALERVRHHLSRGRDAADIAVRERWLMSYVNELVATVKQEATC